MFLFFLHHSLRRFAGFNSGDTLVASLQYGILRTASSFNIMNVTSRRAIVSRASTSPHYKLRSQETKSARTIKRVNVNIFKLRQHKKNIAKQSDVTAEFARWLRRLLGVSSSSKL